MHRTLAIDGLANVRDLGGLERSDGSTTPSGVFVRAERLDRVTAQGWQGLQTWYSGMHEMHSGDDQRINAIKA